MNSRTPYDSHTPLVQVLITCLLVIVYPFIKLKLYFSDLNWAWINSLFFVNLNFYICMHMPGIDQGSCMKIQI